MRKEDPGRRFSRELKIAAVQRMAAGANVSKLAREFGISRKTGYKIFNRYRTKGWRRSATAHGGRCVTPTSCPSRSSG
jgi:transposase-like protein